MLGLLAARLFKVDEHGELILRDAGGVGDRVLGPTCAVGRRSSSLGLSPWGDTDPRAWPPHGRACFFTGEAVLSSRQCFNRRILLPRPVG